jgi:hypothetical protein
LLRWLSLLILLLVLLLGILLLWLLILLLGILLLWLLLVLLLGILLLGLLLPWRILLLRLSGAARPCAVFIKNVPHLLTCKQKDTTVGCLKPEPFIIRQFRDLTLYNTTVMEIDSNDSPSLSKSDLQGQG